MLDEQRDALQVRADTARLVAASRDLIASMRASSDQTSELVAETRALAEATRQLLDKPLPARR